MSTLSVKPVPAQAPMQKVLYAVYIAVIAFMAYASVYAFRKPFTIGHYDERLFFGISYQSLLIIAQVIGYALSKFAGIRIIAALKRTARWKAIALLMSVAWFSLFVFAFTVAPFGIFCLFVNGFTLGFLWGIIFSYIEGRVSTDFIGAVMAVSFIFAGGFTRAVGKWILSEWHSPDQWMPFLTGFVFFLPLCLFVFLLERITPPDEEDIKVRTERVVMTAADRKQLMKKLGAGLIIIIVAYVFLTILRDARDNYMSNIWAELGYGNNAAVFLSTETSISLVVLLCMALLVLIRKNMVALKLVHAVIAGGFLLVIVASILFQLNWIPGALWMQLSGLGMYMAYIPFNCIFFERLIAAFKVKANVGFLMYTADAFGYIGSVALILFKEFGNARLQWVSFYTQLAIILSVLGIIAAICSAFFFNKKYKIHAT